jgi:hypothetical protein
MLSRLPHQGKSLTLFRLFNWTYLHKIGTSAGNVKKKVSVYDGNVTKMLHVYYQWCGEKSL